MSVLVGWQGLRLSDRTALISCPKRITVSSHLVSKALWLFNDDRTKPIWVTKLVD